MKVQLPFTLDAYGVYVSIAIFLLPCLLLFITDWRATSSKKDSSSFYCGVIGTNVFSVVLGSDDKVYLTVFDFDEEGAKGIVFLRPDMNFVPSVWSDNPNVHVSLKKTKGKDTCYEMAVKLKDTSKLEDFAGCTIRMFSPRMLLCEIELATCKTAHSLKGSGTPSKTRLD